MSTLKMNFGEVLSREQMKLVVGGVIYWEEGVDGGGCSINCFGSSGPIDHIDVDECPDSNPIGQCPDGTENVTCSCS